MRLLEIIKPTNLILVAADPAEIVERRRADSTRNRDVMSSDQIRSELETSKTMIACCSVVTGAPFAIVTNNDGQVEQAASDIVRILGVGA